MIGSVRFSGKYDITGSDIRVGARKADLLWEQEEENKGYTTQYDTYYDAVCRDHGVHHYFRITGPDVTDFLDYYSGS
jgi:hypothetical protein